MTSRRCARPRDSTAGCACPARTRRARPARRRSPPAVALAGAGLRSRCGRWPRVYGHPPGATVRRGCHWIAGEPAGSPDDSPGGEVERRLCCGSRGLLELVLADEGERGHDAEPGDDHAGEERRREAVDQGVGNRRAGRDRIAGLRGCDRRQRGDAECAADLLRGVDQPGGEARLGRLRRPRARRSRSARTRSRCRRRSAGSPAGGR